MRFLSVCSGIEAASAAWTPLGWESVAFSEIEPFPCSVLAHHYPNTPNWGDMTKYQEWPNVSIDLLCGGTPCQSFSVAGLRKGLDDPRGNLMLTFGAIAAKYRPKWLVWENVPGVLSSNGGRDFGSFLGLLGVLGYGFAYRVLDAQYVRVESHPRAVPQRRRRVFVVGHSGGQWQRAAAVLFERESLRGHPAPRRQAGKGFTTDAAPSLTASGRGVERTGETRGQDPVVAVPQVAPTLTSGPSSKASHGKKSGTDREVLIPVGTISVATGQAGAEIGADMAPTLNCNHEAPYVAHSLRGEGFDASEDGTGRGTPLVPVVSPTLDQRAGRSGANSFATSGGLVPAIVSQAMSSKWAKGTAGPAGPAGDEHHNLIPVPVAFAENSRGEIRLENGDGQCVGTLNAGGGKPGQGTPCIAFPERMSGTQCASSEDVSPALGALNPTAVAFDLRGREGGAQFEGPHATANIRAASGGSSRSYVATQWAVRRLTPLECERLQGFPDGHTNVPRRGKPAADGPRYKALGNSWAVNCARWIGERIEAVEAIK